MTQLKNYLGRIALANGRAEETDWFFYPGMLQDSPDKWWDDWKFRHAVHEGVDICFYREPADKGPVHTLGPGARIPALAHGVVRNICPDFLGHSIVVEPMGFEKEPRRILWVYSHQTPVKDLAPGSRIKKDQIISHLFDTRIKASKLLSHLHLSCMEVPRDIPFDEFNWGLFPHRNRINLINPVWA